MNLQCKHYLKIVSQLNIYPQNISHYPFNPSKLYTWYLIITICASDNLDWTFMWKHHVLSQKPAILFFWLINMLVKGVFGKVSPKLNADLISWNVKSDRQILKLGSSGKKNKEVNCEGFGFIWQIITGRKRRVKGLFDNNQFIFNDTWRPVAFEWKTKCAGYNFFDNSISSTSEY